ncbi:ABC transporter permease [Amnibacterium flavum]|uniref:ABC transporter permease n=1 Tax=Amnibacterium flavum TaxID=2173173 RepID=A0A2V1HVC0_9MICO|nr:ABC transporter permease [Amnibacterium flavum]PVZ94074.1 ABC transporter permease [Amnibacterium flavum]
MSRLASPSGAVDAVLTPPGRGIRGFASSFRRRRVGIPERVALVAIVIITVALPFAPLLAPYGSTAVAGAPFTPPGIDHLLGTDSQGRDVFSRVLVGLGASWFGAIAVIAFGVVLGSIIGLIAGFAGGIVDTVLMRLTDAALALPATLVALVVVAALGPSLQNTLIAVAVTWWPWYARIVRGQTRAIMTMPHVDAARLGGFSRTRIALVHVLPGSIGTVLIAASLDVGAVLLVLATLSFIGLGSPSPAAEIGSMTADGLTYLLTAPWVALAPATALFVLALLANFAGDGLRELAE